MEQAAIVLIALALQACIPDWRPRDSEFDLDLEIVSDVHRSPLLERTPMMLICEDDAPTGPSDSSGL